MLISTYSRASKVFVALVLYTVWWSILFIFVAWSDLCKVVIQYWTLRVPLPLVTNASHVCNWQTSFLRNQRIQYAKTKSDIISKADGTFTPRERRRRHDERGRIKIIFFPLICRSLCSQSLYIIWFGDWSWGCFCFCGLVICTSLCLLLCVIYKTMYLGFMWCSRQKEAGATPWC